MIVHRLRTTPINIGAFAAVKHQAAMNRLVDDVQGAAWIRFQLGAATAVGRLVKVEEDKVVVDVPDKGQLTIPAGDVLAFSRARAGFMLMEVVIAMALVGMMISVLLSGIMYGIFVTRMNRDAKQATQILVDKTESIRLVSFDQLLTSGFVPSTFTQDINGVRYDGQVIISPATTITSSYSNDLRQVEVRVDWKTGNLPRHRAFTTLVACDGLQSYVY